MTYPKINVEWDVHHALNPEWRHRNCHGGRLERFALSRFLVVTGAGIRDLVHNTHPILYMYCEFPLFHRLSDSECMLDRTKVTWQLQYTFTTHGIYPNIWPQCPAEPPLLWEIMSEHQEEYDLTLTRERPRSNHVLRIKPYPLYIITCIFLCYIDNTRNEL